MGKMELTFLGAADTVTGSRTLVRDGAARILVDCGIFQGAKAIRARNRQPFPVDPSSIDSIVLTHAHLDHSGFVPALVRAGFEGEVLCSPGTAALCEVLWPDAGHLQEEEARFRNKTGTTRHHPARPLYTAAEASRALRRLRVVDYGERFEAAPGLEAMLTPVGHIVGAASVHVEGRRGSVAFSGDVGRPNDPVLHAPRPLPAADVVVVESTYGGRRHAESDPEDELGAIVRRTAERGGVLLVPSFAVGRTQTVLHLLARLKQRGAIPDLPVFLNSPMAIDATELFCKHSSEHRLTEDECRAMCHVAKVTRSVSESKALNSRKGPMVIVSASGMATGGRILHHLVSFVGDGRNTVLFVGYQAAGTRGEAMVQGARDIKIHGAYHSIGAEIARIDSLSAHADGDEILAWLRHTPKAPKRAFVNHGEPSGQEALRLGLQDGLGWPAEVALHGQTIEVG